MSNYVIELQEDIYLSSHGSYGPFSKIGSELWVATSYDKALNQLEAIKSKLVTDTSYVAMVKALVVTEAKEELEIYEKAKAAEKELVSKMTDQQRELYEKMK